MSREIAADFNASQTQYQVNASFRGSYPETMAAAIAAAFVAPAGAFAQDSGAAPAYSPRPA